jgi:hypothetical protein
MPPPRKLLLPDARFSRKLSAPARSASVKRDFSGRPVPRLAARLPPEKSVPPASRNAKLFQIQE